MPQIWRLSTEPYDFIQIIYRNMSDPIFEKTLTLGDAIRLSGPMAFNIMIKSAGSLCNLDCQYCYYLDKAEIYGGREPRMSEAMLEKVIKEYIDANEVPEVTFNWHGGEPLGLTSTAKPLSLRRNTQEIR